jgi:hypothetical protein
VVSAIEDGIDEVSAELSGGSAIVLHPVKACFLATLIIAMQGKECVETCLIAPDPGIGGQHLTHLDPSGIGA